MQSGLSQRRCNLLLVEDQLDLAALMEHALEDAGDQVTHAYSVFDALGLLDTQRFDGAVLDVELRDGVVFPVADRLAELGIPFLFVSAVYDQLVPQRHRRAAFVTKPFPHRSVAGHCAACDQLHNMLAPVPHFKRRSRRAQRLQAASPSLRLRPGSLPPAG